MCDARDYEQKIKDKAEHTWFEKNIREIFEFGGIKKKRNVQFVISREKVTPVKRLKIIASRNTCNKDNHDYNSSNNNTTVERTNREIICLFKKNYIPEKKCRKQVIGEILMSH